MKSRKRTSKQSSRASKPTADLSGDGPAQRVLQFRFTVALSERNYTELRLLIAHLANPLVAHEMGSVDEVWIRHEVMREVMFLLHNYAAAAKSLVDHSRVLYRELYEPAGLIPEYQEEVDRRFVTDPLTQFVGGLREMAQHQRLPSIRMTTTLQRAPDTAGGAGAFVQETRFVLAVPDLRKFSGWKAPAKTYLEKAGDEIDIAAATAAYHAGVAAFHMWFGAQQATIHGSALDEFEHRVRHRGRSPEAALLAEIEARVAALETAPRSTLTYAQLHHAVWPALTVLDDRLLLLCKYDAAVWIDVALAAIARRFTVPPDLRDRLLALATP